MTAGSGGTSAGTDAQVVRLRTALREHPVGDRREARSLAVILDALDRLAAPFDRHGDPTHVTASGIVVGRRGVLLLLHRRLHRWLQPGGHVDPGESPEEAAVRECREETGLPVCHDPTGPVLLHVDAHRAAQGHVHLDLRYLLRGPDLPPDPPPGESQQVAWFTWDEAAGLADVALVGALRAARRLGGAAPGDRRGDPEEDDG